MIFIDLETYHEHLDVRRVGAYKYARGVEVMLFGYRIGVDGESRMWDRTVSTVPPTDLAEAWERGEELCSFNCDFERQCLNAMGWHSEPEDWHDVAVLALTVGAPGKLETLSAVLGWGDTGKKKGDRLINTFCKPAPKNHKVRRYTREHKPEDWADFIDYCLRDVDLCARIWTELPHNTYDRERENWLIDQRINARGIPVDLELARTALQEGELAAMDLNDELFDLTGGAVATANQIVKLQEWLGGQGVYLPAMDRAAVTNALRRELPAPARRALEIRAQVSQSSRTKYARAIEVAVDGRVYGGLRFYGANRTGREAGVLLQPQNMRRPGMEVDELAVTRQLVKNRTVRQLHEEPLTAISKCVRTVIAAPRGRKFVIADLANIEGRRLAALAGEEWKLQAFREFDAGTGPDLYKVAYSRSFGVALDIITKDQRQIGKVSELACGYQGALGAFHSMGELYDVHLPDDEVERVVRAWRGAHPATVAFWYACERAAVAAMENPNSIYRVRSVAFRYIKWGSYHWLILKLSSGRVLFYLEPKLVPGPFGKPQVSYIGNRIGGNWGRITSYGGKFVENITQADCRDILMPGIARAEAAGYSVVMHAHDEIVAEVPDTDEFTVQGLVDCMIQPEPWYADMPLAAAGYEDYFYRKD